MRLYAAAALALVASCYTPRTPRAADLAAWRGVPLVELETKPRFAALPRAIRKVSDGSEVWDFASCEGHVDRHGNRIGNCCHIVFHVRETTVESVSVVGQGAVCFTDCSFRPASHPCTEDERD